jgi:hypothetical protein
MSFTAPRNLETFSKISPLTWSLSMDEYSIACVMLAVLRSTVESKESLAGSAFLRDHYMFSNSSKGLQ